MTALLDGFRARALAIVCTGRGTDGSLGVVAQNRAIASGRFRPSPSNAPLESLGMESLDRAVRLAPMSTEDTPGPNNELSSAQLRTVRVALDVGYVQGATSDFVDTKGSEIAATVQYTARERAISDAETIKRALTLPSLYQDASDDPVLVDIRRDGASTVSDLGDRVICRTVYAVVLQLNATTAYNG